MTPPAAPRPCGCGHEPRRSFKVPTVPSSFGEQLVVPAPLDADAMIVCTWNGGGLRPRALLLLHQLYTEAVERILADDPDARDGVVVCVPIRSAEYAVVCGAGPWLGEVPPNYVKWSAPNAV
jgi:hypothetical protein